MISLLRQTLAVSIINIKSLPQRLWQVVSMALAIALVVIVLLAFLALSQGFQHTLVRSGAEDIAIVMRGGVQSEMNSEISREQLDVLRQGVSADAFSAEVNLVVDGYRRTDGSRANLSLRGLTFEGSLLRPDFQLTAGRMFNTGAAEILVGRNIARDYQGFDVGAVVTLGVTEWTVVGIFEASGSVAESEIWADISTVQSLFNRQNRFQVVRIKQQSQQAQQQLKQFVADEPRLPLSVQSEREYFAAQAARSFDLIRMLGWPMAIIMAVGAFAAAINTMYTLVSARVTEIATLRAMGFAPVATFLGTLAESLLVSVVGGVVGLFVAWLIFNGMHASTFGSSVIQVGFTLRVTPVLLAEGILLACLIGIVGGFLPALQAAWLPVARYLSR